MSKETPKKPILKAVNSVPRPTKEAAMEAVRTLIAWAGDNPEREGLIDTPKRVVNAYQECCLLYTSPSPRDGLLSRMPSSA